MNKLSFRVLAPLALGLAVPGFAAGAEWTGFITDSHCGPKMASKDHSPDCVEKCVKSGSKVHLVDETDKKMYDLDDAAKVTALAGKRITIKGTLDSATNTIKVESAAPAKETKEKTAK